MRAGGVTMPFGKHRGRPLSELPLDYLDWLVSLEGLREPLRSAVEREYRRRVEPATARALPAPVLSVANEIVTRGYRALAVERHPDRGGDHEAMVALGEARDALRTLLRGGA